MINRVLGPSGQLTAKKIPAKKAPLSWHIRNRSRWSYIKGLVSNRLAKGLTWLTDIPTLTSELSIRAHIGGEWIDYGTVAYRVVTDAGVAYLVDDWDGGAGDIDEMDFHGCGTGTTAEAAGDTAIETESTTALNPDSTRATGTNSQPAANQFQTVGTLTFDASAAITEHGILDQAATGGGILWDRSVFSAINVASGDSIQFTYTCTITSGS